MLRLGLPIHPCMLIGYLGKSRCMARYIRNRRSHGSVQSAFPKVPVASVKPGWPPAGRCGMPMPHPAQALCVPPIGGREAPIGIAGGQRVESRVRPTSACVAVKASSPRCDARCRPQTARLCSRPLRESWPGFVPFGQPPGPSPGRPGLCGAEELKLPCRRMVGAKSCTTIARRAWMMHHDL